MPRWRRERSGLVLAAGAGSRFGGGKLLASVGGRPVLQHVLDALAAAGIGEVIVVLGGDARAVEAAIAWRSETARREPGTGTWPVELAPGRLRCCAGGGRRSPRGARRSAARPGRDDPDLARRPRRRADRPIVVPVFEVGQGRNPVLLRRAGLRPRRRDGRRPGSRPGHRRASGTRHRGGRQGRQSRRGYPRRPGGRPRSGLGDTRAREPRTGGPDPRGPRRPGLLRPGHVALPRRSDEDRGCGAGRAARPRPVRRHVAGRRRRGGSFRAAAGPGARSVGWVGRRARHVALDARRAPRDGRGLRHRERPGRRGTLAARRPRRGRRLRGGRRAHRARRLRHRGDRAVPPGSRGRRRPPVRGGPDGASAGVGSRPVLAAGPRGGAGGTPRAARGRRDPGGPRPPSLGRARPGRGSQVRDPRRARRFRAPPTLDRPGRARRRLGSRPRSTCGPCPTATAGRSRTADRATSGS